MNKILSRISAIIEEEHCSTSAFERSIGASKGVLSRAITNGTDIQSKWITNIVENYPRYSAEWLITGEGEMIKHSNEAKTPAGAATTGHAGKAPAAPPNSCTDRLLLDIIRQQAEEIGRLKERLHALQAADKTDKNSPPNTT